MKLLQDEEQKSCQKETNNKNAVIKSRIDFSPYETT